MFALQYVRVKDDRSYLRRCLLTFLPLFLFGAFRTDCGDYDSYETFFEGVHGGGDFYSFNERMEYGFTLLNHIMPSYRMLMVVTSLFVCITFAYFFYKNIPSKYSWLGIIFLFLSADKSIYFMLGSMRNSIAISMLLWSVTFIRDRKYIPMIVTTIVAALFHTSSLIFFPIAFFIARNEKMGTAEMAIWIVAMAVLIMTPITTFLEQIVPYVDLYFERYESYVDESRDAGTLATLGAVLMALPALIYMYKNNALTKEENTIGRLALCFMYSYFLGSLNVRISQYYMLFFLPYIVSYYERVKDQGLRIGYVAYCGLFLAYALFVVSANNISSPFVMFKSFF